MNSRHDPVKAAIDAAQSQRVDPVAVTAQFFAFSVPTLKALGVNVVPCMCGRCHGVGVQFEARMHFPHVGPPELITRGDADKPKGE